MTSFVCRYEDDESIIVQINVFDEQKQNDDEVMVTAEGIDLNDHQQVFQAVFLQVCSFLDREIFKILPNICERTFRKIS